ncbi:MAG: ribose 5-phosphate isomerase A [Alphaproteobacteria bacterium]|nr:ribose 5-phosphate isomerase A [Alphaproteobacteria bacterium]
MAQLSQPELKARVGAYLAGQLPDGAVIGVGSGSSVQAALKAVVRRVQEEGLRVRAVVSSLEGEAVCVAAGIDVLRSPPGPLVLAFDGADEVDPDLNLIKGRGGAILRERMVAGAAERLVILVDDSKLVERLGARFPVPVEVFPEAVAAVTRGLQRLGASEVTLRPCTGGKDGPVITEYGHVMLDCRFEETFASLAPRIRNLPGVVECGLFDDMADEVLVADQEGIRSARRGPAGVRWTRVATW